MPSKKKMVIIRKPVVAGQFYSESFEKLDKQINNCFKSKLGPGDLPVRRNNQRVTHGVIIPHAGYQFSGPGAAWAFKEIAESKLPSRFIIIGPNHTGFASSEVSTTLAVWETPFGQLEPDEEFIRKLLEECDIVKIDHNAHSYEHSIEVQLPFLQFANKDVLKKIKIVPLIISHYDLETCRILADKIIGISEDLCVIASSDFTHYGPSYGYTPFTRNVKENLYELDKEAINLINKMDTKGFFKHINDKRATICGAGPIMVCMKVMRNLGIKKGELLRYYTSGDIIKDYTNAVGYAAIKF